MTTPSRAPADGAPNDEMLSSAAADVLAERQRQVETEGWTPEHDDTHTGGELAMAAACYAAIEPIFAWRDDGEVCCHVSCWPWGDEWWKPRDRRHDLVKAGALILAEIERLDRAMLAARASKKPRTLRCSMIRCDQCDNGIIAGWLFCPYCGHPQSDEGIEAAQRELTALRTMMAK